MSTANDPKQTLELLRKRVLDLHKALLAVERSRYEAIHGRIESNYQFWGLLTSDPEFAWLGSLTTYIVELEERLDDKEHPVTAADVEQFGGYLRQLTTSPERNPEFSFRYTEALQKDAGLLIAHNVTMSTVPKPKPDPDRQA
ncbi:MAG: hypothetical protein IT334_00435 [Thermomicrobiales bacterium]|nr:hypothetical protein [Thermomicrobiales bacterium]